MAGDNLFAILAMIRAEMPEVPDEAWDKIKRMLGAEAGGERVYVPKTDWRAAQLARMDALDAADQAASAAQISSLLGVSVRHARRLRRLK